MRYARICQVSCWCIPPRFINPQPRPRLLHCIPWTVPDHCWVFNGIFLRGFSMNRPTVLRNHLQTGLDDFRATGKHLVVPADRGTHRHRFLFLLFLPEPCLAGVLRRRNSSCRAGCFVAMLFSLLICSSCLPFHHPGTDEACDLNKIPMIATCSDQSLFSAAVPNYSAYSCRLGQWLGSPNQCKLWGRSVPTRPRKESQIEMT